MSSSRGVLLAATLSVVWPTLAQTPARDLRYETEAAAREHLKGSPVAQWPGSAKRWALVIGVDSYTDGQITPLRGASNDASALAQALVDHAGFPQDQVVLLASNQPEERQPTRGNVLLRLSNLARLVPSDGLLMLSFSGHGIERNGQAFLLPSDARVADNIRVLQATALGVGEIRDWIQEIGVKQVVVLLDACRNDPMAGRSSAPNPFSEAYQKALQFDAQNSEVEAFAILYATKVGQRAYEYAEKRQGYFTWALIEGLRGAAADGNGDVTLGGLERFVQDTVPRRVSIDLGAGLEQRPFAEIRGYRAGELVIAKPGARVVGVAPVPSGPPADQRAWQVAAASRDAAAFRSFVAQFPASPHAPEARRELEALERTAQDQRGILETIQRYQESYAGKDIDRVRAIWPGLNRRDVSRLEGFFQMARSVQLELRPTGSPVLAGDLATLECQRRMQFADERGPQPPNEDRITVRLRRAGGAWVIESVQ